MKVLVDADACPVVDITIRCAQKYNTEVVLIADTSHCMERAGAKTVIVEKGSDSADFHLVNMVTKNDIVVTQDYGLAAMAMAKGAIPINQNGLVFTCANIDSLLESRHISRKIRNGGGRTKGPKKRTKEQNDLFVLSLEKLLSHAK